MSACAGAAPTTESERWAAAACPVQVQGLCAPAVGVVVGWGGQVARELAMLQLATNTAEASATSHPQNALSRPEFCSRESACGCWTLARTAD